MHATGDTPQATPPVTGGSSPHPEHTSPPVRDEERAVLTNRDSHAASGSSGSVEETASRTQGKNFLSIIMQTLGTSSASSTRNEQLAQKEVHLEALVKSYRESNVAKEVRHEIDHAATTNGVNNGTATPRGVDGEAMRDVAEESTVLRGRRRASWTTQFRILSGRAFKNLYRNPALLTAHYTAAIAIAGERDFTDIRLPLTITRLSDLWYAHISRYKRYLRFPKSSWFLLLYPRVIWILVPVELGSLCKRENTIHAGKVSLDTLCFCSFYSIQHRANGYYSPFTYFTSKVRDFLSLIDRTDGRAGAI
jgi:hypothetical protein